jgi:hypothetical protein
MNRRGVLGMLGLGAAAGPVVAKDMIYQTSYPSPGLSTPAIYDSAEPSAIPWDPVETLSRVKAEYNTLTDDPSKWIADYVAREYEEYMSGYSSYRLDNIDPDIRNMKSISESAKMRMYITRKAQRRYESNKNSLFMRIQELMKEV